MTEQLLDIAGIRLDGDTQPRVVLDECVVHDYAEALREGAEFPAIQVVHDGAAYWLIDGYHRLMAHRQLGRTQIKAEVITGDLATARWLCLAANKTHGLRRTNLDKRRAVNHALSLRPELSDAAIAEHVGVSVQTVSNRRSEIETEAEHRRLIPTATFKNGKSCAVALPPTLKGSESRAVALQEPPATRPASSPPQPVYRTGRDGRRINVARIGRARRPAPGLQQPPSPEHMAHSLIRLFSTEALRVVVTIISKHLEDGAPRG